LTSVRTGAAALMREELRGCAFTDLFNLTVRTWRDRHEERGIAARPALAGAGSEHQREET
jgi:hypothetical protein